MSLCTEIPTCPFYLITSSEGSLEKITFFPLQVQVRDLEEVRVSCQGSLARPLQSDNCTPKYSASTHETAHQQSNSSTNRSKSKSESIKYDLQ